MTLLGRIFKLRIKVVFKALPRGVVGFHYPTHIEIDLRSSIDPSRVFVHECIHRLEPTWSEKDVLKAERKVWRQTSRHDRYRLGRKLYRRPYKQEEP